MSSLASTSRAYAPSRARSCVDRTRSHRSVVARDGQTADAIAFDVNSSQVRSRGRWRREREREREALSSARRRKGGDERMNDGGRDVTKARSSEFA